MKISPEIEKKLKEYFNSLAEKEKIIKRAKKLGRIWIVGEISNGDDDNENGYKTIGTLKQVVQNSREFLNDGYKIIEVCISSRGGPVSEGLAICDYLRNLNIPLITTAYGEVKSMATIIFELGAVRRMTAGSTLMLHHVQSGVDGTGEKMLAEALATLYYDDLLFTIVSMRSGIPLSKLKKISRPLTYFTPDEAIKLNLADVII